VTDYPHVTQIIQEAGLSDYGDVPQGIMNFAANRGDVGHKTCELYDLENLRLDTVDERIMPYLQAWIKFKKDTGAVIEVIEQRVVSEKYHYQGTPDRIAVIGGKRGLLEIKLTAQLMPSTAYQLAAYQQAWNEQHPTQRATTKYAVLLRNNGIPEYPPKDFFRPGDFNVFLSALVIMNAKKERKI